MPRIQSLLQNNINRLNSLAKFLLLFGVFAVCFLQMLSVSFAETAVVPKVMRTVSFELDAIEDAKSYEVEITKPNGKLVGRFPLKTPVFSGKLAPGKFRLRSRSTDTRGVSGEWSDYESFEVLALAPTIQQPADQSRPARDRDGKTQFVWESAPGAVRYRVDLKRSGSDRKITYFTDATKLSLWLDEGEYALAITSLLADGAGGERSSSRASFVLTEPLDRRDFGHAELWWNPVPKAAEYDVEISDETRVIGLFGVERPEFSAPFKAGKYKRRTRARTGELGEWSKPEAFEVLGLNPKVLAPASPAQIETSDPVESRLKFKWLPSKGASQYTLEVTNVSEDGKPIKTVYKETERGNEAEPKLEVGKAYQWTLTPLRGEADKIADSVERGEFVLLGSELLAPKIEVPTTKFVTAIKWVPSDVAKTFDYVLERYDRKTKSWLKVEEKKAAPDQELPLSLKYPGGRYKLSVRSVGEFRKASKFDSIVFPVQNGDRSPEPSYEARKRESLEVPTGVYLLASYLVTVLSYSGEDPQSDSSIAFDAYGGTGRLGIGYNPPKSDFGYLGIVDLSGFRIADRNYTFAAAEGHFMWRRTFNSMLLKSSTGLFYKELVEVRGELGRLEISDVKTVSSVGPHVGFDLTKALTPEYGIQINARAYVNAVGVKTPNGLEASPTLSYQLGVMASKKLRRNSTGYVGYAYRVDNAAYKSTPNDDSSGGITSLASPDSTQKAGIRGHYLNLMVEW